MNTENFIKFWSNLSPSRQPFIHPEDVSWIDANLSLGFIKHVEDYLNQFETDKSLEKKFHTNLIPVPFMGDLRQAKIFIVMLNPGVSPDNYVHEKNPLFAAALFENLNQEFHKGEFPSLWLNPSFAHDGAYRYWTDNKRLLPLIEDYAQIHKTSRVEAQKNVASRVAVIQLLPYHSKTANTSLVGKLPSSCQATDFIRHCLVPRAIAGDILLVIARQKSFLDKIIGLPSHVNIVCLTDSESRGAYMGRKSKNVYQAMLSWL